MFALGYRPRGKDQHKTVVEFCSESLGQDFQHLTTRFNRMRSFSWRSTMTFTESNTVDQIVCDAVVSFGGVEVLT